MNPLDQPMIQADHNAEGFCHIRAAEMKEACHRFFLSRGMPIHSYRADDIQKRKAANKSAKQQSKQSKI